MNDVIKVPYLDKTFDVDDFVAGCTAQEFKEMMQENPDELNEDDALTMMCNEFRPTWNALEKEFGHLDGLWDDCIEPQLREWFGFKSKKCINANRWYIYHKCKHHSIEVN